MSIQPCTEPDCSDGDPGCAIRRVIASRAKDLGGFPIRRVLPASAQPRVGPFVFFDHMGPACFPAGRGIDVRPHPHIGLSTVTYLFDGVIQHRDSLGSDQQITPRAVNWMTAGRGIVHSERTPDDERARASTAHGLQVWLGLPSDMEETDPTFVHHPADTLPRVGSLGAMLTLIAGEAYGERSPVETLSPTLYLAGEMEAASEFEVPTDYAERAIYLADGAAKLDGQSLEVGSMAVLRPDAAPLLEASEASRVAIIGGAPLEGERHLWWNFVSSRHDRIEQAKDDWKRGRFADVPGDTGFTPLPED